MCDSSRPAEAEIGSYSIERATNRFAMSKASIRYQRKNPFEVICVSRFRRSPEQEFAERAATPQVVGARRFNLIAVTSRGSLR